MNFCLFKGERKRDEEITFTYCRRFISLYAFNLHEGQSVSAKLSFLSFLITFLLRLMILLFESSYLPVHFMFLLTSCIKLFPNLVELKFTKFIQRVEDYENRCRFGITIYFSVSLHIMPISERFGKFKVGPFEE